MKVVAIIVTFNRLPLLKKCIKQVKAQTRRPDLIIVINNGSTDDTASWLNDQDVIAYHSDNVGGAGGFSFGIAKAYSHGADWIWLMDDDTIPNNHTLESLLAALHNLEEHQKHVGFLSSKILWTDNNIHEMNRTYRLSDQKKLSRLSLPAQPLQPLIQFGTFVSMLLSARAVEQVGLPLKEYFIWNDDVEYSKRIINSGLAGIAVEDSIATHETPINHISSVFKDTHQHLWKYEYGLRNELFTKRMHGGELQFWITWVHRMFIMPFRIIVNRKTHRWPFIKTIWNTSLRAVKFKPAIDWVEKR
ncbi:glycosyltransferase family 2 protein [Pedobacter endophyticus]|uniref:Glycosyltransferase family 2 protein n=1 Tax=Pedobacter endophyticus TaxID=2789740 RepID=A0A7S9PYT7_9SPHI|nr:glycosyltransferase family 2 protein [Pedobacter endophyticus]QPH39006.1 glycosyltransferase family 2 protein [Pedobacter endophyticus]